MKIISQRASLAARPAPPDAGTVIDLWSVDETWRAVVDAHRRPQDAPIVLLSSIGLVQRTPLSAYERILADRETQARRDLPYAVTLRLSPVFDDLEVYDEALMAGQAIYHAYGAAPVRWLSAATVVDMARLASTAPPGAAFDVAGDDSATFEEALAERARALGAPRADARAVPAAVLHAQLSRIFGGALAHAVVGLQQWSESSAGASASGTATVHAALAHEATPWRPDVAAVRTGENP